MTHMTAEAIMVCNLCRFLLNLETRTIDDTMGFIVYMDSSSAKALAQRRGVGRLKHVDLRHLWVESCASKVAEIKESGNEKQRGRFEFKEFECGQKKISVWIMWFVRESEEDFNKL